MQDLYATAFRISAHDLEHEFEQVAAVIAEWAWRGEGDPPNVLEADDGVPEVEGYRMSWANYVLDGRVDRALEVTLNHPDPSVAGRQWRSVVDLVLTPDSIHFSLRLARYATELLLVPAALEILRRPNVVPSLLNSRRCLAGGLDLIASAPAIHVTGVEDFVQNVIRADSRVLPVIVLSTQGDQGGLIRPQDVADRLAGLAHVAYVGGHLAWERLKEGVGEVNRLPYGGARIYWPGFGTVDDRLWHRYWTRQAISELRAPFEEKLFGLLARVSVHAVPLDARVGELKDAMLAQRVRELAERSASNEDVFEEIIRENQQLLERNSKLAEANESLRSEVETHRLNYAAMASSGEIEDEEASHGDLDEETILEPQTWDDFIEYLDVLEGPHFILTHRAREAVALRAYQQPTRMWRHLERLSEAAHEWAAADCQVGQDLKTWMHRTYGIEISLFDAGLGRGGQFEFDGRSYSREPHVKVDDHVDPARCGRIYFAIVSDERRFIVDHIGLHL